MSTGVRHRGQVEGLSRRASCWRHPAFPLDDPRRFGRLRSSVRCVDTLAREQIQPAAGAVLARGDLRILLAAREKSHALEPEERAIERAGTRSAMSDVRISSATCLAIS